MTVTPTLALTNGIEWRPGIGDPTLVGWLTVIAYVVAAMLCIRQTLREESGSSRRLFWGILAVMMVLLGINKQLDLQTWFTITGRNLALSEGWYERRRTFLFWFILAVACGGFLAFATLRRLVQEHGSDLRLPLLGVFLVTSFVVIRAASFHHIDEFLHSRVAEFKMNWLLELGGIGIIIVGALWAGERLDQPPASLQDA
jgi:hypothetical protein